MTLRDLVEKLDLSVCCAGGTLDREVTGGYTGDLLSDVMAHSRPGEAWITIQMHVNVVAVASLKELSAIIIVNGRTPAADTLAKAAKEEIPILASGMSAFEISGRLHRLGIGGAT